MHITLSFIPVIENLTYQLKGEKDYVFMVSNDYIPPVRTIWPSLVLITVARKWRKGNAGSLWDSAFYPFRLPDFMVLPEARLNLSHPLIFSGNNLTDPPRSILHCYLGDFKPNQGSKMKSSQLKK